MTTTDMPPRRHKPNRAVCLAPVLAAALFTTLTVAGADAPPPPRLQPWLAPQQWERDTPGPIVELGERGAFDDTHIFAPCVAFEHNRFQLWYCGSTGRVAARVFHLGLAASSNGKTFSKSPRNPVLSFGDGRHSILTPALLRHPDGSVLRQNGRLRMWFSSTHFSGGSGLHTLHETSSKNGLDWSAPSPPMLKHVYAPTILKENGTYRMWYTDVSSDPWVLKLAESGDGATWRVHPDPVMTLRQSWESGRLFYPTVVKSGPTYLMWYGSYWKQQRNKTALGFAVSLDGIRWHRHPDNPVLRPDPQRPWESHYTTSQSVVRLPDGSWRIWYASRKAPPFVNKYYAINTARWKGIATAE